MADPKAHLPTPVPIDCQVDGLTLRGLMHFPATLPAKGVIVGLHGLLGTRESGKQVALAHACAGKGMVFCRFDHRGCGASDGEPMSDALLECRVSDVTAMTAEVIQRIGDASLPLGLFGSSFGGATAIAAGHRLRPRAIVTVAALADGKPLVAALQESPIPLPPGISPRRVGDFDITHQMHGMKRLLVIHGEEDELVPVTHATRLFENARDPKRLLLLPKGDHRLSHPSHQTRFADAATAWFTSHLF